jgi:hypothetical protein
MWTDVPREAYLHVRVSIMNTLDVFYILILLLGVAHPPIGVDTLVWPAPSGMYSSEWHSTKESIKFTVSARCCLLSDYRSKSFPAGSLKDSTTYTWERFLKLHGKL